MPTNEDQSFSRAMLTGLFIGIVDTLICLAFNIGYREYTGYEPSAIVNVSSLIFGVNLLLLLAGLVYFAFFKIFGNRDAVFVIVFVALTAFLFWKADTSHRFEDHVVNKEWDGLLAGIVMIMGVSAILLPFCFRSRFFDKHVL